MHVWMWRHHARGSVVSNFAARGYWRCDVPDSSAASDIPIGCSGSCGWTSWCGSLHTYWRNYFFSKTFSDFQFKYLILIWKKSRCKSLYKMTFVSVGNPRQNFFQTFFVVKTQLLLTHVSIFMLGCLCFSSNILNWIQIISKIMYLDLWSFHIWTILSLAPRLCVKSVCIVLSDVDH